MRFQTRSSRLPLLALYLLCAACAVSALQASTASAQTRPRGTPEQSAGASVADDADADTNADEDADWTRVQRLSPGTDVLVVVGDADAVGDGAGVPRIVLSASDRTLTLLDVTHASLTGSLRRALRDIATEHPGYFAQATAGNNTVVFNDVRLNGAGIFEKGQRVTSIDTIVTTIPRDDVREVATRRRGRGFWGHLGPLGGYFIGGMAGGFIGASACRCDGGFLPGLVAGGLTGAVSGWRAAHRQTDDVIYRVSAP